jgi:hypothetical protein
MTWLLDSVSVDLKTDITIDCPPNDDPVGTNFTTYGTWHYQPDRGVIACWVEDYNGNRVANGTVTSNPASAGQPNDGTWQATFAGVRDTPAGDPDDYLVAEGTSRGTTDVRIRVSAAASDPCAFLRSQRNGGRRNSTRGVGINGFSFRSKRPLDPNARTMPLAIYGTLPVALAVGGPNPRSAPVAKVMLGSLLGELHNPEGSRRWLASFPEVPAGNYELQIMAEEGSAARLKVVIGEKAPRGRSRQVAEEAARK